MNEQEKKRLIALPIVLLVGAVIAWAGSQNGIMVGNIPVFALCIGIAFLIQWLAFIPAYIYKTEKFYDLTGSITYITLILFATLFQSDLDGRTMILAIIVGVWALRLGTFLFRRILRAGEDTRFREIKASSIRFFIAWTIQGLWVSITLAAALAAITSQNQQDLGLLGILGLLVWVFGFSIEVIADFQNSQFKGDPDNEGKFINTGLWSWSRHPNYFGEIVLWIGITLIALPVLQGWQYLTLISPIFVIFLLTQVSGIPLLEQKADERWGGKEDYEKYKESTPVLIPRPPSL